MTNKPLPIRREYDMPDGIMSALHFGPLTQPIRLVFCHANGFNAQSYTEVLNALNVHAVALDLRGHGFSRLPIMPENLPNWYVFRDDITYFCQTYVKVPVVLAGHSFGAISAALSAPLLKESMAGYVGFDPVIVPPLIARMTRYARVRESMKNKMSIAAQAGRRRSDFKSNGEAFSNYKNRGAFKGVSDKVLRDYLAGGLKPKGSDMTLACDPLWEQAIFCAQSHKTFAALKTLPAYRRLIFAGKNSPTPRTIQKRVARKLGVNSVASMNELQHLFPLHHPEKASRALQIMIEKVFGEKAS